jgi:solute carrier family 25 (mitochondrial folate transporter), member 32
LQDHAAAGIGAGVVTTLTMNPLDLLKVKFQVETKSPVGGPGKQITNALRDIYTSYGWKGLYRGAGANIAGQTASWGFYFLLYVFQEI